MTNASSAASPAASEDKAPHSLAPPPPASQPATQRHAHGQRRLGISLAARVAPRLRPPPTAATPLPGPAGTRDPSAHLARRPQLGGTCERVLTSATAACFPFCASEPMCGRDEPEITSYKSETAPGVLAPDRRVWCLFQRLAEAAPRTVIFEVGTNPLGTKLKN